MSLLVKKAGAAEYGSKTKVLICGDPGAGKTRISSTWPDVLYASAEAGLMSVVDREPHYVDIRSSDDMNMLCAALAQPRAKREQLLGFDPKTVCIDTVDEWQRILIRERLDEQKKEALAIADWGAIGDQMRSLCRRFRNLDELHVIFCCHLKTEEDSETGRVVVKPQLQGAVGNEIASYVDLALLLKTQQTTKVIDGATKRVDVRLMQTAADLNHPWIKDRSGQLPRPEFEVDLNHDFERIYGWVFGGIGSLPASSSGAVLAGTSTSVERQDQAAPPADRPVDQQIAAAKATSPSINTAGKATRATKASVPAPAEEPGDMPATPDVSAPPPEQTLTEPEGVAGQLEAPAVPEPKGTVPDAGTGVIACENPDCPFGGVVESDDQADFGRLRYRKALCRRCFQAMAKPKR